MYDVIRVLPFTINRCNELVHCQIVVEMRRKKNLKGDNVYRVFIFRENHIVTKIGMFHTLTLQIYKDIAYLYAKQFFMATCTLNFLFDKKDV